MVQEEEAREPQLADQRAAPRPAGARPPARCGRPLVAIAEPRPAELGQAPVGARVLRARIAVAEIAVRSKRSRSASRAVSATASGWSRKRAAAVAGDRAAPPAELPRRRPSVSSSVAPSRTATSASWSAQAASARGRGRRRWRRRGRRAARRARPASGCARGRAATAAAAARSGSGPARTPAAGAAPAPPRRRGSPRSQAPATRPSPRAAGEADQALRPPLQLVDSGSEGWKGPARPVLRPCAPWASVISRQRLRQPIADSTRSVMCADLPAGGADRALDGQLRAHDRAHPDPLAGVRELHRPADVVVVGQRQRLVAQLGRARRPARPDRRRRRRKE